MTYLDVLRSVQFATVLTLTPLLFPWLLPARMRCGCTLVRRRPHLVTGLLLLACILTGIIAAITLYRAFFQWPWWIIACVVYAFWSWEFYREWKKHKNNRKNGSLAKLLAKVKVTAAGLRVVPVKG